MPSLAADDLAELGVVAHGRRDDDLATLVVVGDHGGDVGHVAAVIFEVEAAAADDPPREPDAGRLDQHVGELVDEQVGVHPAAEVPVTTPLGVLGAIERLVGGEAELGPEEHLPVDGLRVHVLGQGVVAPLADVLLR